MTLNEFCQRYNVGRYPYGKNADCHMVFQDDIPQDQMWTLFHLDDYVVSSAVSGPTYILRNKVEKRNA